MRTTGTRDFGERRRRRLRRCVGGALGLLLACGLAVLPTTPEPLGLPTATASAAARPNFVVFLVDDMRADEIRYLPKTRKLLAASGRNFTNALSPHPLCCPARAELMTGQYAQNNGVRHNEGVRGGFDALRGKANTLGRWLTDSGYKTAYVGKYLNGYTSTDGRQAGWTKWKPLVSGLYHYRNFRFYGETGYRDDYVTKRISDRTVSSIRSFHDANRPFLVFVSHIAPHQRTISGVNYNPTPQIVYRDDWSTARNPAFAKPSYNEADVSDKPAWVRNLPLASGPKMQSLFLARIRSLRSVDDAVARTVQTLRDTGELRNTYLFFTSDNGFSLGEHRWTTKNRLVDENLRVPLLVRGPGIAGATRDDRLATLLDIPRTIAAKAGVTPQRSVDGLSLLSTRTRDTVLTQVGGSERATNGSQWYWRGVMTRRYAWAVNVVNNVEETLYDHAVDPYELNNVAQDPRYAAVRDELERRYLQLRGCSGPTACNPAFGAVPDPLP